MPTDRSRYADIIDYHKEGFARLQKNWPELVRLVQTQEEPETFIPFLSYEWHSLAFGDHNVYYRDSEGPLVSGSSLDQLEQRLQGLDQPFMVIPHHIGYHIGYRGIDWAHFKEARSPLVEIFSLHGCSESDLAPYPQMHTMGPRNYRSTAEYALKQGHKFGFIGSTDHHGGFPGSYGDGRVGVWAKSLSRNDLWAALRERRTCAVTGDKIGARLRVNGAWPGERLEDKSKLRQLEVRVEARDFIDYVEVLKNETVVERIPGRVPSHSPACNGEPLEAKVRIEWGWGQRGTREPIEGELALSEGALLGVEPCFRGETILSPDDTLADPERVPHRVTGKDERRCRWRSLAIANPSPRQAETQALIATVRLTPSGRLRLQVNDLQVSVFLQDLLEGSRSYNLRGWLSEAVRIHRAVPQSHYTLEWRGDDSPEAACDVYRIRVKQQNGQWAWTSPIWVVS